MESHIISNTAPLIEAISKLNALSGGVMTLFAVDSEGVVTGSLTDGDVRRALLDGVTTDMPVSRAANPKFKALTGDTIDIRALREFRQRFGATLIPRIDASGRISEIIDTSVTPTRLPVRAILMAGGKGERLRPLTLETPKPLLEIGGRPIIDHNISALTRAGVNDVFVTVNYLADKIERHFDGTNVKCVRESMPLGTIGAASLIDMPEEGNTIVMNSDLLTTISFEEMYLHHTDNNADITIAAVPYNVSVPYAILSTSDNRVTALEEKPSYAYYANAGIYIISNRLLRGLPQGVRTDATDLIEQAIGNGLTVTYFPISGTWIDIGSPVDFAHAQELMRHHIDSNR